MRGARAKTLRTVSWRVWERLGGSGRVWECVLPFFRPLFSLRICISLSVSGSFSRFQQPRHDSHGRQTHAGQLAVGGAGCCFRTLKVALSRVKAGRLPVFGLLRMASHRIPCCLCCAMGKQVMGSLQSCHGPPRPSDSLCQRASWLGDDSTLSAMPIEISAPSHYLTVFDAIARISGGSSRVK